MTLYAVAEKFDTDIDITKKSGFFGIKYSGSKSKSSRKEIDNLVTTIVADFADIQSGDDLTLYGTEFDTLTGASLQAGVGPNAKADAQVIFRGVQDSVITEETYESDNLVWFKNSGEGSTVTTLKLPSFTQTPYVKAPGGIQIDVGFDLDQQQAKEQIALSQEELGKMALDLAKQPGFEYIADLDAQGVINWQAVALIQNHWEYENEGLTAGAAMLISLTVAVAIGPGAGALFGGAGLGGATAGALGAQGALYTGLSAGFTGLYTQAAAGLVAYLVLAFSCALDCWL